MRIERTTMRNAQNSWLSRPLFTSAGLLTIGCLLGLVAQDRLGNDPDLDTSFTYQGQVRDAGAPITDSGDVILSLWNAAADGTMVGPSQPFDNVNLVEGRFAVEPDFGANAFNGSKRWIELAFRSPSGVGEFITLAPRQAVNAAPYALYALNGRIGPEGPQGQPGDDRWTLDADSGTISYLDGSVGIGTDTPVGVFEVAGAPGDASVELPDQAISSREILGGLPAAGQFEFYFGGEGPHEQSWEISIPRPGHLLVMMDEDRDDCNGWPVLELDGVEIEGDIGISNFGTTSEIIQVDEGTHYFRAIADCPYSGAGDHAGGHVVCILLSEELVVTEVP